MKNENSTLLKEERNEIPRREVDAVSKIKGIVAMFGWTLAQSTSRVCVQALDRSIPDFELNLIRSMFTLICMSIYFAVKKTFPRVERRNFLAVFLLSVVHNLSTCGLYISVTFIPVTTSECINLTSTLVSGLCLFKIINKESITWDKVIAVPVCLIGVLIVLQPYFIFGENVRKETEDNHSATTENYSEDEQDFTFSILGYSLSVATGITAVFSMIIPKYYSDSDFFTVPNLIVSVFWVSVMGVVVSAVIMLAVEEPVLPHNTKELLFISGHMCTHVFTLFLFMYASLYISGNLGSIIRTATVLEALAAQYTVLKHIYPGHMNWIEVLGALLVLFGNIFSSMVEICKNYSREKESSQKS